MTQAELNKFKNILEAKQAELAQFARNREGIAVEKSPDALDQVQYAAERELTIRNLDRESNLLRNVRAALRRIDEGTFGVLPCSRKNSASSIASGPTRRRQLRCKAALKLWTRLKKSSSPKSGR